MTEIRSWTSYAPAIREPLLPTAPPLGVIQEVYYFQGGNNGPVQVSHYLPGIYGFYVSGYSLGHYKYTPTAPPSTGTLVRPPSPYGEKIPSDAIMSVRIKEVIPSAPPLELMDIVSGYETASYDAVTAPPPPTLFESLSGPAPIREAYASAPGISEEEAKDALLQYISEKCCYGKAAARDLTITKVNYSSAFHYKLETFTEKRQTSWAYEPYKGETLDTLSNGTAPMPWDITVPSPEPFQNNVIQQGVPHTESMKSCHACHGTGQVPDGPCLGSGDIPCIHCHGDGTRTGSTGQREHCFFCQGTGKERCNSCGGSGKLTCKICAGKGQLKCYIKLTISWANNVADHIVERTNLPSGLIKKVSGQIAFEEELPRVWPINHFPDNTINMASAQLVQQHAVSFGNERVIMQRQQVRIIPVTEIHYQWKSHRGKFSVYGFENKVYAPEYPQTCCWGMCSIL